MSRQPPRPVGKAVVELANKVDSLLRSVTYIVRLVAVLLIVLVTVPVIEAARGTVPDASAAIADVADAIGSDTDGQKAYMSAASCPAFACQNGLPPDTRLSGPRDTVMTSAAALDGRHPLGQVHAPLPRPPWGTGA